MANFYMVLMESCCIHFMYVYNFDLLNFHLSCSYVIAPYNEYPELLGLLLKLLNGELAWSTRREVLKVSAGQLA